MKFMKMQWPGRLDHLTQRGDTIIEVLIAITLVSGVIGLSYASASRSSNIGQNSQERSEALQLAQSQIELLRNYAPNFSVSGSDIFDPSIASFCINPSSPLPVVRQSAIPQDPSSDDYSAYNSNYCTSGADKRYHTSVVYRQDDASNNKGTFTIRVRWDRIGGSTQKQEVMLVYRLHKAQYN